MKELRLAEGRATPGYPRSAGAWRTTAPHRCSYDFDPDLSYFRVTLPAHPEYLAIVALRDAAYLKATGDERRALARIRGAWEAHPTSALLAASLIHEYAEREDLDAARDVHDRSGGGAKAGYVRIAARYGKARYGDRYITEAKVPGYAGVAAAMADAYLDAGRRTDALTMLDRLPAALSPVEAFDAAMNG